MTEELQRPNPPGVTNNLYSRSLQNCQQRPKGCKRKAESICLRDYTYVINESTAMSGKNKERPRMKTPENRGDPRGALWALRVFFVALSIIESHNLSLVVDAVVRDSFRTKKKKKDRGPVGSTAVFFLCEEPTKPFILLVPVERSARTIAQSKLAVQSPDRNAPTVFYGSHLTCWNRSNYL